MSLIPIDVAMHHLRAESDDQDDVQRKLASAEEIAMNFMCRRVFADESAMEEAINTGMATMDILINERAELLKTEDGRAKIRFTQEQYERQVRQIEKVANGIVINPAIEAGILLILGSLYAHREDVVVNGSAAELPKAAEHYLQPYRIMGV